MPVSTVDIGDIDESYIQRLQDWGKFEIDDQDLKQLLTEIRRRKPYFDEKFIRIENQELYINNQIGEKLSMIPSTKIDVGNWNPKENWIITPDERIMQLQGWGEDNDKIMEVWENELTKCLYNFMRNKQTKQTPTGAPKFKIIRREMYGIEEEDSISEIINTAQSRIRIDIQWIDEQTIFDNEPGEIIEWTIGYYSISKKIKGERLRRIIEKILGPNSRWNYTPGIIIFSRDSDEVDEVEFTPLSRAMNLMFKLAVAMTTSSSNKNLNEIFLEGIWNDFGNDGRARMHELVNSEFEHEHCFSKSTSNYEFSKIWKQKKSHRNLFIKFKEWFDLIQDPRNMLRSDIKWPKMREDIGKAKIRITEFLFFCFKNYDGLLFDDWRTNKDESIYDFLKKRTDILFSIDCNVTGAKYIGNFLGFNGTLRTRVAQKFLYELLHEEPKKNLILINTKNPGLTETNNPSFLEPFQTDKLRKRFISDNCTGFFTKEKKNEMSDNINKFYKERFEQGFDCKNYNFRGKEEDWVLKQFTEINGGIVWNILDALQKNSCYENLNRLVNRFGPEPHVGQGFGPRGRLNDEGIGMDGPFHLSLYGDMIEYLEALNTVMIKKHGTTKEILELFFALQLRGDEEE